MYCGVLVYTYLLVQQYTQPILLSSTVCTDPLHLISNYFWTLSLYSTPYYGYTVFTDFFMHKYRAIAMKPYSCCCHREKAKWAKCNVQDSVLIELYVCCRLWEIIKHLIKITYCPDSYAVFVIIYVTIKIIDPLWNNRPRNNCPRLIFVPAWGRVCWYWYITYGSLWQMVRLV